MVSIGIITDEERAELLGKEKVEKKEKGERSERREKSVRSDSIDNQNL